MLKKLALASLIAATAVSTAPAGFLTSDPAPASCVPKYSTPIYTISVSFRREYVGDGSWFNDFTGPHILVVKNERGKLSLQSAINSILPKDASVFCYQFHPTDVNIFYQRPEPATN